MVTRFFSALFGVFLSTQAIALPIGCAATACASSEWLLYSLPSLLSDLPAQAVSGSNTYIDQKINAPSDTAANYAWSTTLAPPVVTNADGLGNSAWSFDGSTDSIVQANFSAAGFPNSAFPQTGEVTYVVVASLDSSIPPSGTTVYALLGTSNGTSNGWVLGIQARKICFKPGSQGVCTILSGTLSVGPSNIHRIALAWSMIDQVVAASIDGAAWQTFSLSSSLARDWTQIDPTLLVGNSLSSSYVPFLGLVYRVQVYKESLQNSSQASTLGFVNAILAGKY